MFIPGPTKVARRLRPGSTVSMTDPKHLVLVTKLMLKTDRTTTVASVPAATPKKPNGQKIHTPGPPKAYQAVAADQEDVQDQGSGTEMAVTGPCGVAHALRDTEAQEAAQDAVAAVLGHSEDDAKKDDVTGNDAADGDLVPGQGQGRHRNRRLPV